MSTYRTFSEKTVTQQGPNIVMGTDEADVLTGGEGVDYLYGLAGDDIFRDAGGFNLIAGGAGEDRYETDGDLSDGSVVRVANGMLFVKNSDGDITLLQDVEMISDQNGTYSISDSGLVMNNEVAFSYANAVHGSTQQASEIFAQEEGGFGNNNTSWLFSYNQDTIMHGSASDDVFASGTGNDTLYLDDGSDIILFASNDFGHNTVYDFGSDDRLVILGNSHTAANGNYLDYLTESEEGLLFTCGDSSVMLVGLTLDQVHESQFILG